MKRLIYPATRAVENAVSLPGARPLRFFPVLWPLWQVETSAEVYDKQDFELIDHFIVRAIAEGGIHDRAELIHFLNLPASLTDRCLAFLSTIGHLTVAGATVNLTELGKWSAREGFRYVASTSRLTILIDRQTGSPLPRPYYDGDVPILDTPEIEDGQLADRTRFLRVFTSVPYDRHVLAQMANSPDRVQLNLPSQLRNLREEGLREGYLPCYLIETADHQILAYTNLAESRDQFLEQLCTKTSIEHLIEAKGIGDPEQIWRKWHAQSTTYRSGTLRKTPDGGWQVVLDAAAFGDPPKVPVARIGSYQFRDNHFIQIWCTDAKTRQYALKDRSLGIATLPEITSIADLQSRIQDLASSLQVPDVSIADLRQHAHDTNDPRRLQRIDRLTQRPHNG